ncbi:MAG: LutB/LldF family L-lactate oxidation iron-sulfur protein [Peptococcaceae bacterium]|nr:LutB/LldF family L-lactate oxidation iron-sulfur protein [Peptococcaceae bacterium]
MGLIFDKNSTMNDHVQACINNDFARQATRGAQANFNARREAQKAAYEGWETYRDQAAAIRDDVLGHLDYYLNQFIDHTEANGNIVHFATDDKEAQKILLEICHAKGAKSVVKSKSMVSEEIDCNNTLLADGIEVNETDLGEYMIQLDDWNHPSHLLMPGMHMDIKATYDLFVKYGYKGAMEAREMTLFAREQLRHKFLTADIGITGCNFAIASTGTTSIITNEGNGRMVTSLPETQIVLMGMERLLPNMEAFDALMQTFVRHAVGTALSSYMSFTHGPRSAGAQDGPKEVHIIIIDNGRSKILGSKYNKMLRCIRCGTCQNVCPVFRHITGHGYGACYQGPMGIVYTPLLNGFDGYTKSMPYACTLCGECSQNCPVEIPLHELILAERQDIVEHTDLTSTSEKDVFVAAGEMLGHKSTYLAGTKLGKPGMKVLAALTREKDHLGSRTKLPVVKNWTQSRDMPLLHSGEFRKWVKDHGLEGK